MLGEDYKILIGSRIIHEGIDFNSVRFLYIYLFLEIYQH